MPVWRFLKNTRLTPAFPAKPEALQSADLLHDSAKLFSGYYYLEVIAKPPGNVARLCAFFEKCAQARVFPAKLEVLQLPLLVNGINL